jgi:quercetin dioxygenase-like cupin family protein
VRIASGVLIAGTAAAVVGCASATKRPTTPATAAAASEHPSGTLTSLIHQALPNIQGKTLTSATVTVPPGARAVPHRHGNAFVYAYVLEGAVRSQLEGEPMRTYHQARTGSSSQEPTTWPQKNASNTEPAELLVVFVVVALREFSQPASIARWRRHLFGAATAGALSNRTLPRRTRPADRQAARDDLPVAYWGRKGSETGVSCRSLAGDSNWQDAPSRLALGVFALVLSGRPQLCPASGYRNGVSQKLIENSAIPYSIVHATQFFEFVRRMADEATDGSTVRFAPVLFQPIAGDDVAQAVGKIAAGSPLNGKSRSPHPSSSDGRVLPERPAMRDDPRTVVTDPHASYVGTELGERALLPGADAILGEIRYSNWPGRTASGK